MPFSNIGAIGDQFEILMKGLPSSCSEQDLDCYALLRDCFMAVKDQVNMEPQVRMNSETSRSSRPPVRDQSAYFVDKKFYFERV